MKAQEVRPGLVSFDDDSYRVEIGPRRIQVEATPENLAAHGRSVPTKDRVVYDALGVPVTLGKPMTVLDKNRANRVWYAYAWGTVTLPDGSEREQFSEVGCFDAPDQAAAVKEAQAIFAKL